MNNDIIIQARDVTKVYTMGEEKVRRHWRNLIGRYAAYPVIWAVTGEAILPEHHTPEAWNREVKALREGWQRISRYVRESDPFHNPMTAHPPVFDTLKTNPYFTTHGHDLPPSVSTREMFPDARELFDINMLQTGHLGYGTLAPHVHWVREAVDDDRTTPVVSGETCYENIFGASHADVQRYLFWSTLFNGAAGVTYGAMGVWNMNSREAPRQESAGWGEGFWQDAMHLPGATHVGIGRKILERYPWWTLHPVEEPNCPETSISAFSVEGEGLRMLYLPSNSMPEPLRGMLTSEWGTIARIRLQVHTDWHATFINPRTADSVDAGLLRPEPDGFLNAPGKPSGADWVLALERES